MNIGDLFLRILADDAGFAADLTAKAAKAGDAAGSTLGQRMGAAVKTHGAQLIGAALAGGLAIATRGLLELENITADFRAETGATAEEAKKAGAAILAMSSRNIQPLGEIGKVLTKVYTDMGLTGDAAAATAERFLKFGRATKQDATEAVSAFDNVLDAWNLTAADAGSLMDKLIVSHQKFGGSVPQSTAALAAMAPAMQAANMSIDDGIALLNLFNTAGIDASKAPAALAKAVAQLKPGQDINDLIAQIGAIEDPTLRAQKAMEIFGAKSGIGMAQAIKPGMTSLDDLTASLGDTTDATTKAANVLDSTWGARFQLMLKAAGAAVIDFGSNFGPAFAGIAALGSLAGPALKPLVAALLAAGKKGGEALADGLQSVWTGAGGTVIGNNIASRVENILDPKKSTVIGNAYRRVAGKVATVYLSALIAGDAIGKALSAAWTATGGRLIASSAVQGALAGRAFAVAAAAAIIAAPLAVIYVAIQVADDIKKAKSEFAGQVDDLIKNGTLEGLKSAKAAIEAQIGSQKILGIIPFQFAGEVDTMTEQVKRIDAAIAALGVTVPGSVNKITSSTKTLGTDGSRAWELFTGGATSMRERLEFNADRIKTKIHDLTATLLGEAQALIDGYYDPIIAQDELRVAKDQVAADTIARNATKAGTAERHQADLTLANSQKVLDQTRANLLAAGTLSAKEQKTWLAELEKRYKTATGSAKTDIGLLIDKIKELQRVPTTVVKIIAEINARRAQPRATGGPVTAGQPYLINENTPRSEIWIPEVSGRVSSGAVPAVSSTSSTDSGGNAGGNTYIVNVEGLLRARTAHEIGDNLRRLNDFGVLTPKVFADG